MALRASILNDIRVYDLAAGKTLPEWLSEKRRRQLQKDEAFRKRIELIQDFWFPSSAERIVMTGDGQYIVATGTYPPQVHVYDTAEVSLKFERHLDSEVVDVCVLEDDWRKLAFLGVDRSIEIHAQGGRHHRTHVPRAGRSMCLHRPTAELLVVGSSKDVWRLNLEEGRFLAPWTTESSGNNVVTTCSGTGLVAVGGEDGAVELWDPRARVRAGRVEGRDEVMSMAWDASGMHLAAGTRDATCVLWDVRSSKPILQKDHPNDTPVVSVAFHETRGMVVSADSRAIRIWDKRDGSPFTTIEAPCDVSQVCVVHDASGADRGVDLETGAPKHSGLIFAAGAQERLMTWFIPELGPAPRWCSYLESLTEELEEGADTAGETTSAFDDYKFITKEEVSRLGLERLLGTPLLRAFLHGFFIDIRLYSKVRAAVDPDAAKRHAKEQRRAKIEAAASKRIVRATANKKINQKLAEKDQEIAKDERFQDLFSDPAFAIDEDAARVVHIPREDDQDEEQDDDSGSEHEIITKAGTKRTNRSKSSPSHHKRRK